MLFVGRVRLKIYNISVYGITAGHVISFMPNFIRVFTALFFVKSKQLFVCNVE